MNEGVDTIVLYNELAYHDVLPVAWRSREPPLSGFERTGLEESNLVLLQACVAMQEQPARDHGEDAGPLANELARLDFKLNLVLQLLGKLVLRDRMPAATSVQFNAHGASWTAIGPVPVPGERGVLRIHLHESLPQPLEVAAAISAVEGSLVRAHFEDLPDAVGEQIQRLAFLCHRRDVADARKSRGPGGTGAAE